MELTFSTFTNEFTIRQFTGEQWIGGHSRMSLGGSALYLKIPKELELIEGPNVYVQYVGE